MTNIVYFGTSDHSVILLNDILKSKSVKLSLVITKPDKPVGRDQKLSPSPVKTWCEQDKIPFITPSSLKKELVKVTQAIKSACDPTDKETVGLVADYGLIIPEELLKLFTKGVINIHFSLLPKYRGASPVAYTILNGETQTGITFLLTTSEMDKGDIIKQLPFDITEKENDETLYQKLFKLAGESVLEVLEGYLSGSITLQKQNEKEATYSTPSGKFDRSTLVAKDDARLDLSKSPEELERAIRAYYPWPVAWTTLSELASYLQTKVKNGKSDLRVKIHSATLNSTQSLTFENVQVEGGKIIKFEDFKNGYLEKPQIS